MPLPRALAVSATAGLGVSAAAHWAMTARKRDGESKAHDGGIHALFANLFRHSAKSSAARGLSRKQARQVTQHVAEGGARELACDPHAAAGAYEAALLLVGSVCAGRADGDGREAQLLLLLAKAYSDASFAPGRTKEQSHAAAARAVAITAAMIDANSLACADTPMRPGARLGLGALRPGAKRQNTASAWDGAGLGMQPPSPPGSVSGLASAVALSEPYDVRCLLGHSINLGRLAIFADNQTKARLAKDVRAYALAAIERSESRGTAPSSALARDEELVDLAWHAYGRWQNEMASLGWPVRLAIRVFYGEAFPEPGSHVKAEEAYRNAIDINPKRLIHHVEHGRTLAKLGRYADAERALETALGMDVSDINDQLSRSEAERIVASLRSQRQQRGGRKGAAQDVALELKTGLC